MVRPIQYLLLLFIVSNLNAQQNNIINFNSNNGLPTNCINYITKDRYGFYWIATQEGLAKFDGYKFTVFKHHPKDSASIPSSNIKCIQEWNNILILGSDKGIGFYNQAKGKFYSNPIVNKAINEQPINALLVLKDRLIIAAYNGLFDYSFNSNTIHQFNIPELPYLDGSKLFINNENLLLTDKSKGLFKINVTTHSAQYIPILEGNMKNKEVITAICQYGYSIYLGIEAYGMVRIDAKTLELIDEPVVAKKINDKSGTNYIAVTSIQSIATLDNSIFIGTTRGVLKYNPITANCENFSLPSISKTESSKVSGVFSIDNNLWIGTFENGAFFAPYSVKKFNSIIPMENNKLFTEIFLLKENATGKVWIGGNQKLFLYNLINTTLEKDYSHSFLSTTVLSLVEGHQKDKVFVGTWGGGLYQLDVVTNQTKKINIPISDALSLLLDKDTLWIGTIQNGVWKYNVKTGKYIKDKSFGNYTIPYMLQYQNNIFVCTDGSGLVEVSDNKVLNHMTLENGLLSNNTVYKIIANENTIYLATDNGLTIYNRKEKKPHFFFENDGLISNIILAVYLDKDNNLWLNTTKGITKMALKNIDNPDQKIFFNYSIVDGLANYEYIQGANCHLKNGYLLFGGINGIDAFNPIKIKPNYDSVPIYVSAFKKGGKDMFLDSNLILKKYYEVDWKQNYIQFEITAINIASPYNTLYRYKLEGYDDEWSAPTNVRYVSYNSLPGGTYKLLINATNHDGIWNKSPQYIYIKVIPPIWKTTWFLVTMSLFLFGGIFGVNQYRTHLIKQRNKELENKVSERTKELAEKNKNILDSIEYAKRIQQAILPDNKYVQEAIPNAFILYKPKDIVSGDFYWVTQRNDQTIIACVDCTGHGVPGAFMSMIGNNLLNQIVIESNIVEPHQIISEMNFGVQKALKQGHSEIQTNDGMDASVITLQPNKTITWAGAYRPLIIIRGNGALEKIDGNKYPIGGTQINEDRIYTPYQIKMNQGDMIYLFSDGYADQFGGPNGKKIMMRKFISILQDIHLKPLAEQKEFLDNFFEVWKGKQEQIDDILIIGLSF